MNQAAAFVEEQNDFEREKNRLMKLYFRPVDSESIRVIDVPFAHRLTLFPIFSLNMGGQEYALRTPLAVKVFVVGEVTLAENEFFDVSAYGMNASEALSSFRESFDVLYREICLADPATLAPDAVRRRLLELVEP
jgi:hypothetical protein